MAPLSTSPCVALRVYYCTDQWFPDATAGLIINYYTSVDRNEHICSFQHPQRWPVAAERRLSAPQIPPCVTPHQNHRTLCTCKPSDTSRSPRGGSGTCLETTSASPWWPAELSQLQNQGHAHRGPRFYHHKDFAPTAACDWLQENSLSIFCQHCDLTLCNAFCLPLALSPGEWTHRDTQEFITILQNIILGVKKNTQKLLLQMCHVIFLIQFLLHILNQFHEDLALVSEQN